MRLLQSALAQMLRHCQVRTELAAGAHIAEASGHYAHIADVRIYVLFLAPLSFDPITTLSAVLYAPASFETVLGCTPSVHAPAHKF